MITWEKKLMFNQIIKTIYYSITLLAEQKTDILLLKLRDKPSEKPCKHFQVLAQMLRQSQILTSLWDAIKNKK